MKGYAIKRKPLPAKSGNNGSTSQSLFIFPASPLCNENAVKQGTNSGATGEVISILKVCGYIYLGKEDDKICFNLVSSRKNRRFGLMISAFVKIIYFNFMLVFEIIPRILIPENVCIFLRLETILANLFLPIFLLLK